MSYPKQTFLLLGKSSSTVAGFESPMKYKASEWNLKNHINVQLLNLISYSILSVVVIDQTFQTLHDVFQYRIL